MTKIIDFLKTWGVYILVCIFLALLIVLFIISESKNDSSFLRIIYGLATLLPSGAIIPWLVKKGIEKGKDE